MSTPENTSEEHSPSETQPLEKEDAQEREEVSLLERQGCLGQFYQWMIELLMQ